MQGPVDSDAELPKKMLDAEIDLETITTECVANVYLDPDLEQHLWSILCVDRRLGPKFHKCFVRNRTTEDRRRHIEKMYPTKFALNSWVRNVVEAVAGEDIVVAKDFVTALESFQQRANVDGENLQDNMLIGFNAPSAWPAMGVSPFSKYQERMKPPTRLCQQPSFVDDYDWQMQTPTFSSNSAHQQLEPCSQSVAPRLCDYGLRSEWLNQLHSQSDRPLDNPSGLNDWNWPFTLEEDDHPHQQCDSNMRSNANEYSKRPNHDLRDAAAPAWTCGTFNGSTALSIPA